MAIITEDYVSFETAKLLKKKGFDADIDLWYDKDGDIFDCYKYEITRNWRVKAQQEVYFCPTIQMAMKWLREMHNWHIFVIPRWEDIEYMPGEWEEKMVGYQYVIINVGEVTRKNEQPTTAALNPESAYEAGIRYCLEKLI